MSEIDDALYGRNPLPRIVSIEPNAESGTCTIFQRSQEGGTEEQEFPFVPWLLTTDSHKFDGATTTQLDGAGYNFRADFHESGWRGLLQAKRSLQDSGSAVMTYGSQTKQFLASTGMTLFKEMAFTDIRRMQVDIETATLSPTDPTAKILLIAMSDSTGRIDVLDGDEIEMLEELGDRIRRWDPDVIEGHNIFGFDLPYIYERCKATGVVFAVGRQPGSVPTVGSPRNCAIGPNSRPFTPTYIFGRHVIDTYLQVQRFDAPRGQISSYGLKECARVYNISSESRIIVDRSKIAEHIENDPETVKTYARQDVEETRALAALVCPTDFYQTTMMPDVYQNVAVTGNGEKVNSLLVREYLHRGVSIPFSQQSSEYPGGYTEVRRVGVIRPVVKTDVESLYPSLMLTKEIKPQSDVLNIFLPTLSELTKRRLSAKAKVRLATKDTTEHAYWDGLQNSYKTLINSFYGYIGGPFYFNDYRAAKAVTVAGQQIVKSIADKLEETGSVVIEIDTDGIYFKPPDNIKTFELEQRYIEEVAEVLPQGIRLAHDGRYAAMLSLKIKNYVLVEYDGRKIMKGSSLRSRADEKFGRDFLGSAVDLLIADDHEGLSDLYKSVLETIQDGRLPIDQIARRERITTKKRDSTQKGGVAELAQTESIAVGDIVHVYNRQDGTVALESEYQHDEDRNHYAMKLYKFAIRLIDAIGEDKFGVLIPRPKPAEQRLQERLQSSFDF
jgi:DNA polymerase I